MPKSTPPPSLPELGTEDAKKLAEAVRRIDDAVAALAKSGLNRRALVVLLHDATSGVSKRDINAVLDGLEELAKLYLEAERKR